MDTLDFPRFSQVSWNGEEGLTVLRFLIRDGFRSDCVTAFTRGDKISGTTAPPPGGKVELQLFKGLYLILVGKKKSMLMVEKNNKKTLKLCKNKKKKTHINSCIHSLAMASSEICTSYLT